MKSTMRQYFKGHPLSGFVKAKIKAASVALANTKSIPALMHSLGNLNRGKREVFADAIFSVENDLESRGGGLPDHPTVKALRAVRNELYDDLGWNEVPKKRPAGN